jgi:hypothetical protein
LYRQFLKPPPFGRELYVASKKLRGVKTVRFCDVVVFEGESVRFTAKKLRIQLKIQSVRLKRKLDAGFIA